jgi:hypothetical protein
MTVMLTKCDMWQQFPDQSMMFGMIQAYLANVLGMEVGKLNLIVANPYIRVGQIEAVERYCQNYEENIADCNDYNRKVTIRVKPQHITRIRKGMSCNEVSAIFDNVEASYFEVSNYMYITEIIP